MDAGRCLPHENPALAPGVLCELTRSARVRVADPGSAGHHPPVRLERHRAAVGQAVDVDAGGLAPIGSDGDREREFLERMAANLSAGELGLWSSGLLARPVHAPPDGPQTSKRGPDRPG